MRAVKALEPSLLPDAISIQISNFNILSISKINYTTVLSAKSDSDVIFVYLVIRDK